MEIVSLLNLYAVFDTYSKKKKFLSLIHTVVWSTFNIPFILYGVYSFIYNYNVYFTSNDIVFYVVANLFVISLFFRASMKEQATN